MQFLPVSLIFWRIFRSEPIASVFKNPPSSVFSGQIKSLPKYKATAIAKPTITARSNLSSAMLLTLRISNSILFQVQFSFIKYHLTISQARYICRLPLNNENNLKNKGLITKQVFGKIHYHQYNEVQTFFSCLEV